MRRRTPRRKPGPLASPSFHLGFFVVLTAWSGTGVIASVFAGDMVTMAILLVAMLACVVMVVRAAQTTSRSRRLGAAYIDTTSVYPALRCAACLTRLARLDCAHDLDQLVEARAGHRCAMAPTGGADV